MENDKQGAKGFKAKALQFLQKRGIYLVLIVCLAIVGVSAFFAFGPSQDEKEQTAPQSEVQVGRSEDEPLSEAVRPTVTPSASPTPLSTPLPEFTPAPRTASPTQGRDVPPVSGKVLWPFAKDELIYSETLAQWMTHRGVDIAAKKGDEVYAPWAGVVESVYTDDALGVCVVLTHPENTRTLYANLAEEVLVKEGQTIAKRGVIGNVGDTSIAECGGASHIHFELYIAGEAVDPQTYFMFEK